MGTAAAGNVDRLANTIATSARLDMIVLLGGFDGDGKFAAAGPPR
jgi:hypothetical protein